MATGGVAMTDPNALSDMNVSNGLLQTKWENGKLHMESLLHDPLFNSKDLISPIKVGKNDIVTMPSEVFIDATPKDKVGRGARKVTLAFLKALSNNPQTGSDTGNILGTEETLNLKYEDVSANDWANAVTTETFGINYRELSPYDVETKIRPLLSQWIGEIKGYYARHALCERISPNLEDQPIGDTAAMNPNVWVASVASGSQGSYDSNVETFEDNVGTAMNSATKNDAYLNVPEILDLLDYAELTKRIQPAIIMGKPMYLLLASAKTVRNLNDTSINNSYRAAFENVGYESDIAKAVPGAAMVIDDRMVVIRDPRCPEVQLSGATTVSSGFEFTFRYNRAGNSVTSDQRTGNTSSGYWDANILLGRGALLKYEPEIPHFEEQTDVYGMYKGTALFGGYGCKTPIWDTDDTDSAQQESSMLVLTSRVPATS